MKIGLVDVDGHNFPNLCLMKISAWHKRQGHSVDWWNGFTHYDIVYASRVFTDEYTADFTAAVKADLFIQGGTGYGLENKLPDEIEHTMPDYSLYPKLTQGMAYGFLTRGCPRACPFCIVAAKEGTTTRQVAELAEFHTGQKHVKLLDPNLLAAKEHEALLQQLAASGAYVDFTQGLDIRLTNPDNIALLNAVRTKGLHFAWDNPAHDLVPFFEQYARLGKVNPRNCVVYVLTNFGTTHEEDLYRVYTLRSLGYTPYVMIYSKPSAPRVTRDLQGWVNNIRIFRTVARFEDFKARKG